MSLPISRARRFGRLRRTLMRAGLVTALVLVPGAAFAWPSVEDAGFSRILASPAAPYGLVLSPDGADLYVADSGANAILQMRIDPATRNPTAPVSSTPAGLLTPQQVTVSPDGLNVYATGQVSDSLVSFSRDPATGALTYLGAVAQGDSCGSGCSITGLDGAYGVSVSPKGTSVYVTGTISDGITVFERSSATGLISAADRRQFVSGIDGAYQTAITSGADFLYATAYTGDRVFAFAVNPETGIIDTPAFQTLTTSDEPALNGVFRATLSPDDATLYTASYDSDTMLAFARNPITGSLAVVDSETGPDLDAVSDVAVSADGGFVVATSYFADKLVGFARNPEEGVLGQTFAVDPSSLVTLDRPRGVVLSADARDLYLTGLNGRYVVHRTVAFDPDPVPAAVTPAEIDLGAGPTDVTITGTQLTPYTNVVSQGQRLVTGAFVGGATPQLTVTLPGSATQTLGTRTLHLSNFLPSAGGVDVTVAVVDRVDPVLAVTTPAEGVWRRSVGVVSGTATDNHQLSEVRVRIDDPIGTLLPETAVAVSSGTWTLRATRALHEGPHSIVVTGTDPSGNLAQTVRRLNVDLLAPRVATSGRTLRQLRVKAADGAGSGIASVGLTVRRGDGRWWSGRGWVRSKVVIALTRSPTGYRLATAKLPPAGAAYAVGVLATDRVGRVGTAVRRMPR